MSEIPDSSAKHHEQDSAGTVASNSSVPVIQPKRLTGTTMPRERWSVETWATVITAATTVVTLLVAVLLGLHGMHAAEATLHTMSENLKQSNLLTIYTLNHETSKFFEANPKLLKFFEKSDQKTMTEKELEVEFAKLDENHQILAHLGCEKIADFMQVTFLQRMQLPVTDWDNWWSSMCDQFDESPLLRGYLVKRSNWYSYLNAIKPETRAGFYRGTARK